MPIGDQTIVAMCLHCFTRSNLNSRKRAVHCSINWYIREETRVGMRKNNKRTRSRKGILYYQHQMHRCLLLNLANHREPIPLLQMSKILNNSNNNSQNAKAIHRLLQATLNISLDSHRCRWTTTPITFPLFCPICCKCLNRITPWLPWKWNTMCIPHLHLQTCHKGTNRCRHYTL